MKLRPLGSSSSDDATPQDSTTRSPVEASPPPVPDAEVNASPGSRTLKPTILRPKLLAGDSERPEAKPKRPPDPGGARIRPILSQEETVEAHKVPAAPADRAAEEADVLASLPSLRPKLSLSAMQDAEASPVAADTKVDEVAPEPALTLRPKAPSAPVPPVSEPPAAMTIKPRGSVPPAPSASPEMSVKPRRSPEAAASSPPTTPAKPPAAAKEDAAAAAARRQAERPKANLKLQRQANAHKIDEALLTRQPVVIVNPASPGYNLFGTAGGRLFAAQLANDALRPIAKRIGDDESPDDLLPPEALIVPMASIRVADLDPIQATLDVKIAAEDGSESYVALPGPGMKEMNELVKELAQALQKSHRVATAANTDSGHASKGWPMLIGGLFALAITVAAMVGVSRLGEADPDAEGQLLEALVSIVRDSLGMAGVAIAGGLVTLALCGYGLWQMVRAASAGRSRAHTRIVVR